MLHFENELANLKETLLRMASLATAAVTKAIRALVEREDDLACEVIEDDDQIDRLEMEIDELAINLLSKAPLAYDLRLITVAMKASRNLERIGDKATSIARRAVELGQEPQLKPYIDIPRMAALALEMLKDSLDAFVNGDPGRARAVIPHDKEVDALNRQLHRELISYMLEKPATITRCLHLMFISKCLERIADYAKNIAVEVVFLYEAKDIRHATQEAPQ